MHDIPNRPASNRTDCRKSDRASDVNSSGCEYNNSAISNKDSVFANYDSPSSRHRRWNDSDEDFCSPDVSNGLSGASKGI